MARSRTAQHLLSARLRRVNCLLSRIACAEDVVRPCRLIQQQWQARPLGSAGFPGLQHRPRNGSTGFGRTPGPRLCRLHDEGSIQPEGTARHRMASDSVELQCHRRVCQQKVHELGPRKQNAVSKYPVAVPIRSTARHDAKQTEPHGALNWYREGLSAPATGSSRAHI